MYSDNNMGMPARTVAPLRHIARPRERAQAQALNTLAPAYSEGILRAATLQVNLKYPLVL